MDILELIVDDPVNEGSLEKDVDLLAIVRRDRPAINFSDVFLQLFLQVIIFKKNITVVLMIIFVLVFKLFYNDPITKKAMTCKNNYL